MVDNIARQHGLVPPAYQIPPQHFNSNLSHVHYSSTFDKGNPTSYLSPADNSIHSQYNSSVINDLAIEIEELKNTLLSKMSPQEKVIFFAMCPSFSSSHIPPYNSIYGQHNPTNISTLTKKAEELRNYLSCFKDTSPHVPSNPNPNPSHVHYSSTFDKGNPPPYSSPTYNSLHSQYNSSNTNDFAMAIEELKNTLLSIISP